MKLIKTVPSIEFTDLTAPKKFFVDFLGFEIVHEEDNLCVVQRDTVRFHLGIESDYAIDVKNRKTLPPLFRVETDDIESMWNELKERDPEKKYISNDPKMKPWGRENLEQEMPMTWWFSFSNGNQVVEMAETKKI